MDKEFYINLFVIYELWELVEDISDDGEGVFELTPKGEQLVFDIINGI